ncbi:quinone oxidoreductase [Secundilactobacillus silagincola]|uniref:Quinone oxidoreductase n=1 Tax=Secundilactobacillus silagincola TaxID=1714681 RepID=A0A1Z5H529_9LACO|nr:zinc-binding dehydrogenase [Secundilactobacillus silagincola]GAT18407.1 quinone oxidoreductase [Secundilactobacillus silagincola]
MQAIKISEPCEANELQPVEVPTPQLVPGFTLVEVKAFGVNESEVTSRKGESSSDFKYPRILGIEGVGVIKEADPASNFKAGQKVAMMMTGLGRAIDGSYAQYCLAPNESLIPLETNLDWSIVGALPEMLQTAYGSLSKGLNVAAGDKVLIRGGSSTVGLMATVLAKDMGAEVIATTRSQSKVAIMKQFGADKVIIDDGKIAEKLPDGVDKALELVGTTTLFDTFGAVKSAGKVCFTGGLAGGWEIEHFSPFMIPAGKFFTSYAGEAIDLSADVFNQVLKKVEAKQIQVPIAKVYHGLASVGEAQTNLESGQFIGKHVVVLD